MAEINKGFEGEPSFPDQETGQQKTVRKEVRGLIKKLKSHGTGKVFGYIERTTGIDYSTTIGWLLNNKTISSEKSQAILKSLQKFESENIKSEGVVSPAIVEQRNTEKKDKKQRGKIKKPYKGKVSMEERKSNEQVMQETEEKIRAIVEKLRQEGKIE